ncbi:MAG: hypothetical protein J7507_11955 [Pseudoxanthomonas sp.]|nr:hypothetical protein [Pseudoxanthomonas sp.]
MTRLSDAQFTAAIGPLTALSLQRCARGKAPAAPTNEERDRAFRAVQQRPIANNYAWPHRQADEYARAETADGAHISTEEF